MCYFHFNEMVTWPPNLHLLLCKFPHQLGDKTLYGHVTPGIKPATFLLWGSSVNHRPIESQYLINITVVGQRGLSGGDAARNCSHLQDLLAAWEKDGKEQIEKGKIHDSVLFNKHKMEQIAKSYPWWQIPHDKNLWSWSSHESLGPGAWWASSPASQRQRRLQTSDQTWVCLNHRGVVQFVAKNTSADHLAPSSGQCVYLLQPPEDSVPL